MPIPSAAVMQGFPVQGIFMITVLLNRSARKAFRLEYFLALFLLTSSPLFAQTNPSTIANKPALEKVRLQLKWFHQFQFAGYYAAIEQGYYAEEGLEVELLERNLDKSVIDQVISGEADYGVGDSGLLHEYALGKPIVALAAIFQHNPLVFMTKRDSGIISPLEMKGKRIMLDTLSANEAPLRALLAANKISDNDFTLIKQSGDNSLLIRGELDVMTGYLSDEPFYYKQIGVPINIINPQNYGIDFYGDILFTSENERQQQPKRIDRFLRASLKGWRYALDHPEQIITLIAKRYSEGLSLDHLRNEANEIHKLIPDSVPLGYIDLTRLTVLADSYVKAGYNRSIPQDKLKKFIYQAPTDLSLTDAEKDWLTAHPVIRVGVNPNKPPYDWVDEQGQYLGMGSDYLKLLEQKLGIHFTIVNPGASLADLLEMAKRGELDMLAGVVITDERTSYLNFIKPYINAPNVIVDTGKQFFNSLDDLNGKVVAVEKAYAMQEWLKQDYPEIELLEVKDALSGLKLVDSNKADAYVGDIATINYWLKKEDLANLNISGQTGYRSERTIAIFKQQTELSSIINKASLTLDQQQIDDIPHYWFSLQDNGVSKKTIQKYSLPVALLLLVSACWIIRLNREIKLRKSLEKRERRRNNVLKMLANHHSLSSILNTLCVDIEQLDSEIACSILLLSDDGKHLLHIAAPRLPEFYNQAINGIAIGAEVGSCGATAFSGEPTFVDDIQTHPNWLAFSELTQKIPYRACWSQPIKSSEGELFGTFAIYHRKPTMPNPKVLEMINESSNLAGFAIEKSRQDTQTQLAAKVYSHSREGIYITDKDGNIIDCNEAFLEVSGYNRDELLGQNPRIFKSGVHDDGFYSKMWQALCNDGFWSGEIWNKYKNRDQSPGLHSIAVIRNANNEIERFLAITTDISELKQHQLRLEQFAYNDHLTGLPNRLLLTDRLNQLILNNNREQQNLAVAFIDLDGFKAINDNYGHELGDEFLIAISQKMRSVIRESDTLGRLGGDEFVVILNNQDNPQSIHSPINKLIDACNSLINIRGVSLKASASIGVSFYSGQPNHTIDGNELIRQADLAMYVAKQSGKNRYHVFNHGTNQLITTRHEIVDQIRIAIQENELVLYYQPKVNMRTGELLGVEALIRWNHRQNGLLQPGQFLPMIENHPVSVELGNWVIQQALIQINQWQLQGLNIPVSINVDAKQLNQPDFVDSLQAAIAIYPNFRPGSLEIEILETVAFHDREQANLVITACKKLGVEFAMDDFGTGYSSLTYLRQLSINTIKIDRSFVKDIDFNLDDLAIVENVINLGAVMGRSIIAEGVETIKLGELLIKHGCEYGQGYAIAKPMPADQLLAWKQQWRPDNTWLNA